MSPFDEQTLAPWLPTLTRAPSLLVGFSGGLDSTVLLHALCRLLSSQKLRAIYVNHGLSPNAATWQAHCEQVCQSLGVALQVEKVTVTVAGKGLEEAAREQRYRAFTKYLGKGGLLLLAHHRDDQVETVLFRLLRGSGPRGLAGMPVRRPLGQGELLRPLLTVGRDELQAWASAEGLTWIEDESNAGTDFDRNFLRLEVLPQLARRWPDLHRRILRSAHDCGASDQLLREVGEEDLQRLGERTERLGWSLPVAELEALSPSRRTNLLRTWLALRGLPTPGHRLLTTVCNDLLPARDDAAPLVRFGEGRQEEPSGSKPLRGEMAHGETFVGGVLQGEELQEGRLQGGGFQGGELRRYSGRLFLLPGHLPPVAQNTLLRWHPDTPLALPGNFSLTARTTIGGLRLPASGELEVRFRQGGERCKPVGRAGSRPLKKLLQEQGLEPWLRDRVPLIFVDGELAAVGDLFVCEGFAEEGEGMGLVWRAEPV